MTVRNAWVEGRFYPSTKKEIFRQIREIETSGSYRIENLDPGRIHGAVLPHAGHVYSGHQTVPFFQLLTRLKRYPGTFVVVHPNHTGNGSPTAVDTSRLWINAIGEVPVDGEFAEALELPMDRIAHLHEHSAEVIIPFIQYYMAGHSFSIVPICILDQSHQNAALIAGRIRQCRDRLGRDVMVLASCDFSHFLPPEAGNKMDQLVLDRILERDAPAVEEMISKHHISVCGYGPVMTLMEYASSCDRDYRVEILARGHSGQVKPSREVVDYISMIFYS